MKIIIVTRKNTRKLEKIEEQKYEQLEKIEKIIFLLQYNTFIAIAGAIHGTSKEKTSRTGLRIP